MTRKTKKSGTKVLALLKPFTACFHHEAAGGLVLVAAALLALLMSNSPLAWLYDGFLETPVGVRAGPLGFDKALLHWINDGLMAIFFFLVGLEVKRELLRGQLSTFGQAALPLFAALGGMLAPALIYVAINQGDPFALRGWAIPTATDIAFALGVLALLGDRVPASLKAFLLALAVLDDLGAIVIIAAVYTVDLHWAALILAGIGCTFLLALNLCGVTRLAPYLLTGLFTWACVLESGVHATLAGVVTAISIPLGAAAPKNRPAAENLEHSLHPWVTFGILPLFAFANAGLSLHGMSLARLAEPVPLGIALGLFLGKPIGIFGASVLAIFSGMCSKPAGAGWMHLLGVAILGGIGFTMSLFIGTLALSEPGQAAQLRLGVLTGSLLSAVTGYVVLRLANSSITPGGANAGTND
jgi:Na+:H+ antiporter, NhaA family